MTTPNKDWVATQLYHHRPDREEDGGERAWMEPIVKAYVAEMADDPGGMEVAVEDLARRRIRMYDGQLQRRGNKAIRETYLLQQWPLEWFKDVARLPVMANGVRIAIEKLDHVDLETFATQEHKRAMSDFTAREQTVEAARYFAKELETRDVRFFGDLYGTDIEY